MRYRIKNTSGIQQRVRVVPKTATSTISIPDEPINPTLALDAAGSLQVCLSVEDVERPFFAYRLDPMPS